MDKWNYIKLIGAMSNEFRDELLLMMEQYNKQNLCEITYEEAKEYYEHLVKNKER